MFCTFCGTKAEDSLNFCPACGNNLREETKTMSGGGQTTSHSLQAQQQAQQQYQPVQFQPIEFKVKQKILAFRDTYKVYDAFENEFMIIRKEFFAWFRPALFVDNINKERIGTIQGNFWRTKFEIRDNEGQLHAVVRFPLFMLFRKHFDIETAEGIYRSGDSVFGYKFDAYDQNGGISFLVDKKILSIRDEFKIQSFGKLSPFITCLAAICIDQKFHDKGGSGNSFFNLFGN